VLLHAPRGLRPGRYVLAVTAHHRRHRFTIAIR
jgi:hypothetical protein